MTDEVDSWGATYPVAYDYDDAGRMTVSRAFDPHRNLIAAVSNCLVRLGDGGWGSTPISVYAYENDELARRT